MNNKAPNELPPIDKESAVATIVQYLKENLDKLKESNPNVKHKKNLIELINNSKISPQFFLKLEVRFRKLQP